MSAPTAIRRSGSSTWCKPVQAARSAPTADESRDMHSYVLGPYPLCADAPFDVLVHDIPPEDLPGKISQALGTEYLSAMATRSGRVPGIVRNTKDDTLRVLITLPVSVRDKSVATHFILDTCAPKTHLALSVLEALGVSESSLPKEAVKINGVSLIVSVSDTAKVSYDDGSGGTVEAPCHFGGLNILGLDFLDLANVEVTMRIDNKSVVFNFPKKHPDV